jgi:hypothetical protein
MKQDKKDITREDMVKIIKENSITTVTEFLEYWDYEEFTDLVYAKEKDLENGIFRFRYKDRENMIKRYKEDLFKEMVEKGYLLNREKCFPKQWF